MKSPRHDFFSTLFSCCDGYIEVRVLPLGKQHYFALDDYTGIDSYCERNERYDLCFGVATRDGKGGRKDNIIHIPAVWCDLDFKDTPIEECHNRIRSFPFKPSIAVHSGGGYHLYWLLPEPATRDHIPMVEDVNRRIAHFLGGDMAATDASRILRIPGTTTWKYSNDR